MTIKKKGGPPPKETANSKTQIQNTTPLTLRQRRILSALKAAPEGIKSYRLRDICHCMNLPDQIMILRRRGFKITCTMEKITTVDGEPGRIGRYCLEVAE